LDEFNLANGLPPADWQANVDLLEACLSNSTATVKFVVAHESPYSNGAEQTGYPELRPLFGPLFVKYGVSIFFAGHSHGGYRLAIACLHALLYSLSNTHSWYLVRALFADNEHLVSPEGYHVVISGSGAGSTQYGFNNTEFSYFQQPNPGAC
jgi:hypothetical protein